jgi:hypothetical protein
MEAEPNWKIDEVWKGHAKKIRTFHLGSHPDINTHTRAKNGLQPLTEEEAVAKELRDEPKPRGGSNPWPLKDRQEPKPKRQPKQRSREGITLQSVCDKLKIEPKEARNALRKSNTPKPDAGWVWQSDKDVPDIAALVKKYAKGKK